MSVTRAPVNVDALDEIAGTAIVFGRTIKVLHPDGDAYRSLLAIDAGTQDPNSILELYEAVARCCPDLTPAEIGRLRPQQIGALLGIAQNPISQIEEQFPNGNGPAATSSEEPPASPSTIPSGT